MYSVVLMAALATGADAPGCHWKSGRSTACYGCYGCSGCYGCYGCYGAGVCCLGYGSCYGGCWGNCLGCHGCYGCYGCYGCTGYAPMQTAPAAGSEPVPAPRPKDKASLAPPLPAKLIVELPADAKLYVDNLPMKTSAELRTFRTPVLDRGQAYYYELRAEVVRDGQTISASKRVILRAGEESRASFTDLTGVAATKPVAADAAGE